MPLVSRLAARRVVALIRRFEESYGEHGDAAVLSLSLSLSRATLPSSIEFSRGKRA